MKKDSGFFEYILNDVFNGISGITSKSMFGGWGFYKHGVIFGIIADGKLYFKVGESNKSEYEEHGSLPFTYPMKNGKKTTMSYWEVPDTVLEDRDQLENWIDASVQESLLKKKK